MTMRDNPSRRRFEARIGDRVVGFIQYRVQPDRVLFVHTEVDPECQGRGVASRLVGEALDEARSRGVAVVPQCPFVADYVRNHPEYLDLVDAPYRSKLEQRAS